MFRRKRSDDFELAKHSTATRYTFIITSNSEGKTRRFSMSAFLLDNIILFGCIAVAAVVLLLISYVGLYSAYLRNKQDMVQLQAINKEQQIQLYDMSEMAGAVEQKLEYLELLEERIQMFIEQSGSSVTTDADRQTLADIDAELARMRSNFAVGSTTVRPSYFIYNESVADMDFTEQFASLKEEISGIDTSISDTEYGMNSLVEDVEAYERLNNRYPHNIPLPLKSYYITEYYTYRVYPRIEFHEGIDLGAPEGTPIRPCARGTVTYAGWWGELGYMVRINHGNGFESVYAHMSEVTCYVGQDVTIDTIIGEVGSTGYSTGNHLHFEIIKDGVKVDPLDYIPEIEGGSLGSLV
ncbi:MAG: M23 family metallopeptidase [Eubacteriaceae bacterium]|nr:M23 family metallopeptidase [Eubacteriaceae bacterium]